MTDELDENIKAEMLKLIPQLVLEKHEDIANTVRFFVLDQSKYVTGQTLMLMAEW